MLTIMSFFFFFFLDMYYEQRNVAAMTCKHTGTICSKSTYHFLLSDTCKQGVFSEVFDHPGVHLFHVRHGIHQTLSGVGKQSVKRG